MKKYALETANSHYEMENYFCQQVYIHDNKKDVII